MRNRPESLPFSLRRGRSLAVGVATLSVVALALAGTLVPAGAVGPAGPASAAASPDDGPAVLPGGVNGAEAVAVLGEELPQVAAEAGMSSAELRRALTTDETLWVGPGNELVWAEKHTLQSDAPTYQESAVDLTPARALNAADVFALHSNPGAQKVIFLDFDGASNIYQPWIDAGVPAQLRGFDPDDNGPSFTEGERATIEQVWKVVADRFAPWDVDVTTADPGAAGLLRADANDPAYGVQLIYTSPGTPDIGTQFSLNGQAHGGFDTIETPARSYVFPRQGWKARDLADVGAHEVGHNLGLDHHGSTEFEGNYSGEAEDFGTPVNNWSPIMGAIGTPLVQWSAGTYQGGSPSQDDLAIIGQRLALRGDEAPSNPANAVALPASTAYITSETDIDSFALGTCVAGATVTVTPAVEGSSLDIAAAVVPVGGANPSAAANPPSFYQWYLTPPQLDTTTFEFRGVDTTLAPGAGAKVLQVRGGGNGTWADNGYDAYGSVGGYTVDVDGCNGVAPSVTPTSTAPGAPTELRAPRGGAPTTFSWSKPWNDGGSAITGYRLFRQSYSTATQAAEGSRAQVGSLIPAGQLATTFAAPATGTYVYHLVAVNAEGDSAETTSEPFAYGPAVTFGSAPRMQSTNNRVGQTVSVVAPTVTPANATITYQWKRKTAAGDWVSLGTGSTYKLATADIGRRISVTATATAANHRSARSASLASTPVVSAASPASTGFGNPSSGRFATMPNPDSNGVSGPNDVATDAAGFVYVPYNGRPDGLGGNDRIRKFTAGGELVQTWNAVPSGRLRMAVTSVDVGPDGNVYALDAANRQVFTYDPNGTLLKKWTVPLVVDDQMILQDGQHGLTVDDAGNIYVSDPVYGYIQKFDSNGAVLATWGGDLGYVTGLRAVTASGVTTLYYAVSSGPDQSAPRVVKALNASTGAAAGSWNGASTGGAEFNDPVDIATDGAGNLYVVESFPARVQKFSPTFQFLDDLEVVDSPYGIDIGAGGQIYIAVNSLAEEVQLLSHANFNPSGPTNVLGQAGPGTGEATLTWKAPTSATGVPIDSYTVKVQLDGDPASVVVTKTVPGNATSTKVSGLLPSSTYNFTIIATNAVGDSPEVTSDNWIYTPAAPTAITVSGHKLSTSNPKVGAKVSAVRGAWSPSNATVTHVWKIGSTVVSTSSSYTPKPADKGKKLTLTFTGTSGSLPARTVTVTSNAIAAGTLAPPSKLALSGTYKVGKTVKVATTGTWKPTAKVTYQWFANGVAIKGATKSSLKLAKAQAGRTITVKVTAKATGYATAVKTLQGKKVAK